MNVTCDKCGKKYVVADDKVAGKASVKIRCKQCQNLITVSGSGVAMPAAVAASPLSGGASMALGSSPAPDPESNPWEEERTRAMPALDMQATWFAMIQGKQAGPFDLKQLEQRVTAGEVSLRTYLWKPGMGDWKRASDVPEVSPVFAGVSVAATATGPVSSVQAAFKPATVERDVAVAKETPVSAAAQPAQSAARTTGQQAALTPAADPAKDASQLGDLFGDVSGLSPTGDEEKKADEKTGEKVADPFAALSNQDDKQLPPPGEATKFFIAQAGVNKRNPPWKIALFFISIIGLPIAVLYLLSTLHIATVTRINEKGEEVQQPFFSAEGIAGLKDMLSGEAAKQKAQAEAAAAKRRADAAALAAANRPKDPKPAEVGNDPAPTKPPANPDLAALYGEDNGIGAKPIHVRRGEDGSGKTVATSGLSDEAAGKVVATNIKAFESCIDNALRRNPNLAVGSIHLVLTVGPSGSVKSAAVTPKKHENADWATCMMDKGKRLVFPSSDGDTDLELPFKVGVALP